MRVVTFVAFVPASGELLTMNDIDTVGGSIGWRRQRRIHGGIAEGVGDGALV